MAFATFVARIQYARNNAFQATILASLLDTAIAVLSESVAVPNHAERLTLARRILVDPEPWVRPFALTVLATPSIDDTSTDNQIRTAVGNLFTAHALANP